MTMTDLIKNIQREAISNRWANNKGAEFEYDNEKNHYRLIELTPDCNNYLVGRTQRNDNNCPVIAKGFIAYLIRNWGKKEVDIYNSYYNWCFSIFESNETKKPGSFQRNLDAEFYPLHVAREKEYVKFSYQINPYLSEHEIKLINQYIKAYFNYIEQTWSPIDNKEKTSKENQNTTNELSVPDWCIVFYYLDEAGTKEGNKIARMGKFIKDNNVVNPSGELTTPKNFRKEYYEIENRINIKNNKKPLPPDRIKNILPILKKNKKAMQNAVRDMGYLADEIEENKRNTY